MAGSSLLALLDDIATVLDDIALMSKVAAKKTAAVLGDDLALNAEQVSGIRAEREIPVVWAVAKGSFKNKLILVPAALLISAFIPWLITPLLMLGGLYLSYEGSEKILHSLMPGANEQKQAVINALHNPDMDLITYEKNKIKGAIRTDFILSAEIVVIALGTVKDSEFITQVSVVTLIAIVITIGVYGLVAGIVKLDDVGFYLLRDSTKRGTAQLKSFIGHTLLAFAPLLMKSLSIIGTAAMFLVGGSILAHGIPYLLSQEHQLEQWLETTIPTISIIILPVTELLFNMLLGLIAGSIVLAVLGLYQKIFHRPA